MTNKAYRRKQPKRGYDVQMIRDFIDHLTWEVCIRKFEHTAKQGTVNSELVEQLEPYIKKYDCGLLFATALETKDCSDDEIKQADEIINAVNLKVCDQWSQSLESLGGLFKQALEAATYRLSEYGPNELPAVVISARDLLDSKH